MSKETQFNLDKLLDNVKDLYTKEELEKIRTAYTSMKSQTRREAKLVRPIVPFKQWVNDPYYLGADCYNIFPYWKEKIADIVDSPYKINQVILTGAMGTGKTTAALILVIRKLYELSCYENVAALFNLFGTAVIAFAFLSINRDTAFRTGFTQLRNWLDDIPYFQEHFKRRTEIDSALLWTEENISVTFGSTTSHFIGMNLLCSVLDEANFFEGRQTDEADYNMNKKVGSLYSQMRNRSASRFIVDGENMSLSIVASSSTIHSSFTNALIERSRNDKHTYIVSPSQWDVNPEKFANSRRFLVFVGNQSMDPMVVDSLEELNTILENQGKKGSLPNNIELKDAYSFIPLDVRDYYVLVPEEFESEFRVGDIVLALQDLAGYSVSNTNQLFNSNTIYEKNLSPLVEHPFSKKEIVLSTTKNAMQEGYLPLKSYMKPGFKFNNPNAPRYMHLDLSLSGDSTGISMCHISGWKNIYKQDYEYERLDQDMNYIPDEEVKIPVIQIDFMLRIKPPKRPNQISFSKIRDFIIYLKNEHGIEFALITADQFQSAQLMQELHDLGFKTAYQSVDRTADAYLTFVNFLHDERIEMYNYEPFKKELFNVVYYPSKKKVDHLPNGSKDVSDSVVGSIFNAHSSLDKKVQTNDNLNLLDLFVHANVNDSYESKVEEFIDRFYKVLINKK